MATGTVFCACLLQQLDRTRVLGVVLLLFCFVFLPRIQDFILSHDFSFFTPTLTALEDVWTS